MSPQIVFATGLPFSGSTAFGNLVNNTGIGNYLGEVNNLFHSGHVNENYPCLICRLGENKCVVNKIVSTTKLKKKSYLETLATLASLSAENTIIDGSKSTEALEGSEFFRCRGIHVKSIILVKNPVRHITSLKTAVSQDQEYLSIAENWRDFYWNLLRITSIKGIPTYVLNTDKIRTLKESQKTESFLDELANYFNVPKKNMYNLTDMFTPTHQIGGNERTLSGIEFKQENNERALKDKELIKDAIHNTPGLMEIINLLGLSKDV
jgi:hypothetical protein